MSYASAFRLPQDPSTYGYADASVGEDGYGYVIMPLAAD